MSRRPRVRAPELVGRGWLGLADGAEPLTMRGLRGRFVLLDFWTSCCVNCLHVIDELRPVEERWAAELVVVGVHSPKFAHEAEPAALRAAVERHGVRHPVLDDPELTTWQAYTARAWPTLVLVDPEGYVVAHHAGEGHGHAIDALLTELVVEHRERGTLQPGGSPYVAPPAEAGTLRFPASAVPYGDHVLVADAGHDRVVELDANGGEVRAWPGLREPNGLCVVDGTAYVADTAGHRLRAIDLGTGDVRVVAGDGTQAMPGDDTTRLTSPWDVAWWPRPDGQSRLWIAMAGNHTLWTHDPATGRTEVVGGTTHEGLLDGPLADAWFAQTSRLALDADPDRPRLWLVDAETSSLRWIDDGPDGLEVHTAVGSGLFEFGFRDGPADQALLQHPLGVTVLPDRSVAVCDTYNGAVRRFDPATGEVSTLATDLAEPSSAYVDPADPGLLVVVESAAHRLTRVPLGDGTTAGPGDEWGHTTQRPVAEVATSFELVVGFTPPPGQVVDDRWGPATQLVVEATPPALLRVGGGRGTDLVRRLELDPVVGEGVLHVAARAATCDHAADGVVVEGAACRMHQQDWGVPVRITPDAPAVLELPLGGAWPGPQLPHRQRHRDGEHGQPDRHVQHLPGPRAGEQR